VVPVDFSLTDSQQEIARLAGQLLDEGKADPWKELARSGLLALSLPGHCCRPPPRADALGRHPRAVGSDARVPATTVAADGTVSGTKVGVPYCAQSGRVLLPVSFTDASRGERSPRPPADVRTAVLYDHFTSYVLI
jgi:hypothetical protein